MYVIQPNVTVFLLFLCATKDRNVLGEFNVSTKRIASADMYAFRFINSATVQIECDVTVCKNKTCVVSIYEVFNLYGIIFTSFSFSENVFISLHVNVFVQF